MRSQRPGSSTACVLGRFDVESGGAHRVERYIDVQHSSHGSRRWEQAQGDGEYVLSGALGLLTAMNIRPLLQHKNLERKLEPHEVALLEEGRIQTEPPAPPGWPH